MQIVVRVGDREREVVVDRRAPDATVGDLLAELGLSADGIDVDGRYVDATEGLADAPVAVLIMALLGAAMWVAFNEVFTGASDQIKSEVDSIGGSGAGEGG